MKTSFSSRLRRALAIIVNNGMKRVDVEDLVIHLGVSPTTAYRILRVLRKLTIVDDEGNVDLELAKRFLELGLAGLSEAREEKGQEKEQEKQVPGE